jgi:hypothetical protein
VALSLAVVLVAAESAQATVFARQTAANGVEVVNLSNRRTESRLAWQVHELPARALIATNRAVAISRCRNCLADAVAVQTVLDSDFSGRAAVTNQAIAINTGCVGCHSLAVAYQFVIVSSGSVWITSLGWARLGSLLRTLFYEVSHPPPPPSLQARVAALAALVHQTLATQVRESLPAGGRAGAAAVGSAPGLSVEVHVDVHYS